MSNNGDVIRVGEFRRAVSRRVIDDHDLRHPQGLLHDGFEGQADDIGIIPRMDLDKDPHCFSTLRLVDAITT